MARSVLVRIALVSLLVVGLSFASACGGGDGEKTISRGAATSTEPAATTGPRDTGASATTPATEPELAPCLPDESPGPAPVPPPAPPEPEPEETDVPPSLVGTEWEVLPTERKVVALTFDCGANAAGVPSILRTLGKTRAPATFFLTGRWAEAFPNLAGRLGERHPVGNHTFSHPDLTALAKAAVQTELGRAERAIRAATGQDPRPLFRFPYGARDARTIALVNDLGYGSIRWTVDTLGWKGVAGGQSVESVRARVLAELRPGAIVLMHVGAAPDGSSLDADALPSVIAAVRARGYRLVDLAAFVP